MIEKQEKIRKKRILNRQRSPFLETKRLLKATDHGYPITVPVGNFAPSQRAGSWGPYAETFLRFNLQSFRALDVTPQILSDLNGMVIKLIPGEKAGAVPLRSGLTGHVNGGLIVEPRFGWSGVGHILHETGWGAAPDFLDLPLVPGSAREVPPWILAGPVLARLHSLLHSMSPGFRLRDDMLIRPRGRLIWDRYVKHSLPHGNWHHIPCIYPDLSVDPLLRRYIRWTLQRLHRDLLSTASRDPVALGLITLAVQLIELCADVIPLMPKKEELDRYIMGSYVLSEVLRRGIEAIAWIVDERGLGGGSERDGLAWALHLDRLWEQYIEKIYRQEVDEKGGIIKVGRLRETVFPLNWSDSAHRTLGQLIPDIVIRRGNSVQVVDAKYKAHFADIDETGWLQFEEETRKAHRADIHQILAYASLYDADEITATLVYPLRLSTYVALKEYHHDRSFAELLHGGRYIKLELRGLPFGYTHLVN